MTGPQHGTTPLKQKEVVSLLRAWGWIHTGDGRNHAKWRKDGKTIHIRRASGDNISYEPLREAASLEGLNIEQWCQGPHTERDGQTVDVAEEDLDFFMAWKPSDLKDPEMSARYKRIRTALVKNGTLDHWERVKRHKKEAETAPQRMEDPVPHAGGSPMAPDPGPQPAAPKASWPKPDANGFYTLEQGMWIRGLFLNEVTRTSAELLAVLSRHGPIEDEQGRATAKLLALMPASVREKKPLGMTGMSSLLKAWDATGYVWREQKGKRTYKIGISVPVRLTTKQEREYLLPEQHAKPEPPQKTLEEVVEEVRSEKKLEELTAEYDETMQKSQSPLDAALDLLREEYADAQAKANSLKLAIEILEEKSGDEG